MNTVSITDESFVIDAAIAAAAFGVAASAVPELMRAGEITSRCEAGVGADAGRWRLTLIHRGHYLSLVVSEDGEILDRATGEAGATNGPEAAAQKALPGCFRKFVGAHKQAR